MLSVVLIIVSNVDFCEIEPAVAQPFDDLYSFVHIVVERSFDWRVGPADCNWVSNRYGHGHKADKSSLGRDRVGEHSYTNER